MSGISSHQKARFFSLSFVFASHLLLGYFFYFMPMSKPDQIADAGIRVVLLTEQKASLHLEQLKISSDPSSLLVQHNRFAIPEVNVVEPKEDEPTLSVNSEEKIFDPRLRQKLQSAQELPKGKRDKDQLNAWTDLYGNEMVELGDGKCLKSMPKMDARERGTNFARVNCGQTDSRKMMDNVMKDVEMRTGKKQ